MVSRTLREQLFLPLLFWAEVLCELEEHGEEGQTRPGGVPPLCAVDAKGLQPGFSWVSRLWPGARQGAFLRLLLGRLRTCHRFPTSIVPPQAADTHPGLRALDFRESRLCPRGVYILVQEDKQ